MNNSRYQKQREELVKILAKKGIRDEQVLKAVRSIPRHTFVDSALWIRAYEDIALPIGLAQTISQPYTVARQTELLDVKKGQKILEIGTGSGYQCAVLCELGAPGFQH
jgi:protein-L-isoaspartate(D-aspartate) O-methyltransferase